MTCYRNILSSLAIAAKSTNLLVFTARDHKGRKRKILFFAFSALFCGASLDFMAAESPVVLVKWYDLVEWFGVNEG